MDSRWRNLIILLVVVALGYFAFTFLMQPKISDTESRIDSVLSKYGLKRSSFDSGLLVDVSSGKISSKVDESRYATLASELSSLQNQTAFKQGKDLISVYISAVKLSEQKLSLFTRVESLSRQNANKPIEAVCASKQQILALQSDYSDFYLALNSLILEEQGYAGNYNSPAPIGITAQEEDQMFTLLSTAVQTLNAQCGDVQ